MAAIERGRFRCECTKEAASAVANDASRAGECRHRLCGIRARIPFGIRVPG